MRRRIPMCLLMITSVYSLSVVASDAAIPAHENSTPPVVTESKTISERALDPAYKPANTAAPAQSSTNYDLHTDYKKGASEETAKNSSGSADEPARSSCACSSKKWAVEPFVGGYHSIHSTENIFAAGTALEYGILDTVTLKGEFVGYAVDELKVQHSAGAAFNFIVRWTPFTFFDERVKPFMEGGAGINEFTESTPRGGTHFNFSPQVGIGGLFQLSERFAFTASLRYLHISNAYLDNGSHDNPGIDSVGGYVGFQLKF